MMQSPISTELVQLYYRGKVVGHSAPSKLAIPMADAFVILSQEEIRRDNAEREAEQQETG